MNKPDILIVCKSHPFFHAVVSGVTPKGAEWILQNCEHDTPTIEQRQAITLKHFMEKAGLEVEILRQ